LSQFKEAFLKYSNYPASPSLLFYVRKNCSIAVATAKVLFF